jgi:hypothetical protein
MATTLTSAGPPIPRPGGPGESLPDAPPAERPSPGFPLFAWRTELVLLLTFVASTLGLGYSFRLASTPGADPMAPFTPFWLSLGGWLVVAVTVLLRPRTTQFQAVLTLLASALLMSVPKLLRTPQLPLFFDEIAHWGQSQYMEQTGQIDRNNVVSILQDYPGLHAMTAALHEVTHLSTWQLGTATLLVLRLSVPLLIRQLALTARVPVRAANLAGFIYLLNPGFMFFTGMYAYESYAIVFQITALMLALRVLTSTRDRAQATVRLALVAAAGATVTHHLTSIFMALVIVLIPLTLWRSWAPGPSRRRTWIATVGVLELVALWTATNIATIWAYLGVFPQQAAAQFAKLVSGSDRAPGSAPAASEGSRGVLQNTGLPRYEDLLALGSVPLACLLGFVGVLMMRQQHKSPVIRTLALITLAYPVSMPLVLTVSGAPGAHRSWPFSYQGLSVFIAVAVVALAGVAGRLLVLRRAVAVGALLALMIGNCASENHDVLRFPGTFVLGTEGRAQSPELIQTAQWSGRELGSTGTVIADYFTGGYVSAFGKAPVAPGFPAWDILFYASPPPDRTIRLLASENVGFAVIDRRLSTGIFKTDFYIDASEPEAGVRKKPIPAAALTKFKAYPWMQKVYSSTDYDVYRFDLARWQDPAERRAS